MKKLSCIVGIVLILFVSGCGAGSQFVDGLAAISGQGGKIAREDVFDKTVALANKLNKDHPPTKWETVVESEGADFISFLDNDRVIVGTVECGSYLGTPKHGDIKLFDARSGAKIWSARRDGMKNGHYVLLVTEPLIVIVGRDDNATKFLAYDPATGSRRWNHHVKAPDQFILNDTLDRIISLSSSSGGRKMEALDIKTGNIIWSHEFSTDLFVKDIQDVLVPGKGCVFLVGEKVIKLAEKDGSTLWSKGHPILAAKDRAVLYTPAGILIYNSQSMALLKERDGAAKWNSSLKKSVIRYATALDKRVYRVLAGQGSTEKASPDIIQAMSTEKGKVLWSKRIKEKVVSPLCMEKHVLAFTTDKAIYGLKAATGEQSFRNPFSKRFISGCPGSAKTLMRPDIIRFRSGKLYLAREMSGIRAYAFPSGKMLWEQMNFNYLQRAYSADRLYSIMTRKLPQKTLQPASGTVTAFSSSSPSPFIKSAQRRYESEKQRIAAVLRSPHATMADRHSSHQAAAMNAGLMAAQQKVDMAMSQMQAAGDLLVAVVGLQEAIQNALKTTAVRGVISRKYMELRSFMGLPQACFQGKYYLWPFYQEGHGVTLVDLDTGKRNDLIFSPDVQPLATFGVDLPTFCIGPDGKSLVMAGVGIKPDKYEKYVKWKYRMPKPSVLAYDISTFDFMKKSLTQKRAEEAAAEAQKKAEAIAKEMQSYYDKSKLHTAAQSGNLKQVKSLLDSGVDVNTPHPHDGSSPLIFAIIGGKAETVRLLVQRGADVNTKTKEGKSALFWANQFRHKEIVKILKEAGAR